MSQLRTPRELNFNAENLAEEWRRWEKSFNPIKAGLFFAFYVRGGGRFDPTLWQLITFEPLTIAISFLLR